MTAQGRARVLHGIADAIDARTDDIAAAEALGTGLPVTQAGEQAARASGLFRLAADLITARPESLAPAESSYVVARPAGIAGLITSWSTPFPAQARAVAPALAAGCAVVLKPDEWAPLPAALLAEITTAAGLPDGVLNIVHGSRHPKAPGAQARDALIAHPGVARLSFGGEAATGQEVMLEAAGPADRARGPRTRPARRGSRARQHRLLHPVPDRADRGRRHARAAVRSLSGAARPRLGVLPQTPLQRLGAEIGAIHGPHALLTGFYFGKSSGLADPELMTR